MNKKIFAGLVILMGISIIGIIAVQLVWIDNAIKVKNELFGRGVNEALASTARRLETLHDVNIMSGTAFNDTSRCVVVTPQNAPNIIQIHTPRPPAIVNMPTTKKRLKSTNTKVEVEIQKKKSAHPEFVSISQSGSISSSFTFSDENDSGKKIIILRSDTIIRIPDSVYTHGIVKIDSLVESIDTFSFYAPSVTKRIKAKAFQLKHLAGQVVTEISTWDVSTLDIGQIREVLTGELNEKKIPIPFEFGLMNDSSIVYLSQPSDSLNIRETGFSTALYPNNIFRKNIRLAVFFPEKGNFIYRSISWLLLASFVFSMIILLTFAASIFYILKQKKISEMKSDFINNMTHEFKTPIATISVAADSIANEKVIGNPEQVRYFTGMIKKENTRMNRQVEDILTIARLDKKEFEFKWEPVNVHELVEDAVQSILIQVEKRGGQIVLNLQAANPVATTDKVHCTNLVYNLLDNANKYSANAPQITVATKNNSKGVVLSVEDKGIGMSKSVQSKIFERFYRQTSGNIHNVKGFGLGLSYVKAVAEANHGSISVHSEPGKGSRFEVFFPFSRNT